MSNNTFYAPNDYRNYLEHFGVKGMKWGVRRYQNADGSYTSAGKNRYGVGDGETYMGVKSVKGGLHRLAAKNYELNARTYEKLGNKTMASMNRSAAKNSLKKAEAADAAKAAKKSAPKTPLTEEERAARNAKIKKVALAVAGTAAVAAGTYAAHKYLKGTMKEADSLLAKAAESHKDTAFKEFMTNMEKAERATATGDYINARVHNRAASQYSRNRQFFNKTVDQAASRGSTRRKAQRAVIERDYRNARAKAADRINRARGGLGYNVGWSENRNRERLEGQVDNILYNARVSKKNRRKYKYQVPAYHGTN